MVLSQNKFKKIKVLSYFKLNDNSKVIIDYKDIKKDKIYPLITYDGYSAGIALNQKNRNIAYLNNNERSNYTVFIGNSNAPGITSGINENGKLKIKHIPLWKKININDEVITSGMDNIFPYGIKDGKVLKIDKMETTQNILCKPYGKVLSQRYFYIFDTTFGS